MSEPMTKERLAELRQMGTHDSMNRFVVHQLLDEIDRLKQDEARLDWIETRCPSIDCYVDIHNHERVIKWWVSGMANEEMITFRQAIDAAIKGKQP